MYRLIASGRQNIIRRFKKPFNSVISFNPLLPISDSGIAVFSMASQLLLELSSREAQPTHGASSSVHQGLEVGQWRMRRKEGKDSGGSAKAAEQDLMPPALLAPDLWQHPALVMMPQLPVGGWHREELPRGLQWSPCLWHFSCLTSIGREC